MNFLFYYFANAVSNGIAINFVGMTKLFNLLWAISFIALNY